MEKRNLHKVKEHEGFARDVNSGAIISIDKNEYENFLNKKRKEQAMENRISCLEEKLDRILEAINNG